MSKELRKGKSHEFADAVRSLLGLSAFTAAIYHLKGKGSFKSVLRSYDDKYDVRTDSRIAEYNENISSLNSILENIDSRLSEIDGEQDLVEETIRDLGNRIRENANSKQLSEDKDKSIRNRGSLRNRINIQTAGLLKEFNRGAPSYFAKKMIHDSLEQLAESKTLDKGIPDIHARTIDHIIKRGRCICGADVSIGNSAFNELNKLRDYIPPQSLGNLIEQFRLSCESSVRNTETFFDGIQEKFAEIRQLENDYQENETDISNIIARLEGMDDVGKLQAELIKYENQERDLQDERSKLNTNKGAANSDYARIEAERQELTLRDKNNRRIETYKAFAMYLHEYISTEYTREETRVREELNKAVDEIFRSIYNGGFSLSLDEKYNVQVLVNDHAGYTEDVETSTAQSISIIFAFIAGVIKMARDSQNPENEILVSEPYPLVMDAPLSAFDTTRIKTVCDVLPEVAEQVIIFIKDTDGDLAEKYMSDRIGSSATFIKQNEFETQIVERG